MKILREIFGLVNNFTMAETLHFLMEDISSSKTKLPMIYYNYSMMRTGDNCETAQR